MFQTSVIITILQADVVRVEISVRYGSLSEVHGI